MSSSGDAPHEGVAAHLWAGLGGLALLGATLVPWTTEGFGSTVSLHRLADLVLSGATSAWVPRSAGLVVYAIPLGGALVLVGSGLGRRHGLLLGALGVLLAALGTGAALAALAGLEHVEPSVGPAAALGGLVAAAIGTIRGRPRTPTAEGTAPETTSP